VSFVMHGLRPWGFRGLAGDFTMTSGELDRVDEIDEGPASDLIQSATISPSKATHDPNPKKDTIMGKGVVY
jgi:hypothetical protein